MTKFQRWTSAPETLAPSFTHPLKCVEEKEVNSMGADRHTVQKKTGPTRLELLLRLEGDFRKRLGPIRVTPSHRQQAGSGLAITHIAARGGDPAHLVSSVCRVCLVRRMRETRQTRAPDRLPLNRPPLTQRSPHTAIVIRCTTNEWGRKRSQEPLFELTAVS